MKKLVACLLTIVMVFAFTACGGGSDSGKDAGKDSGSAASGETITISIAHEDPEDSEVHKSAEVFKKEVEEKSGGRITVEIHPNGELGGESEFVDNVKSGAIQMTTVTLSVMNSYDQKYNVMELPFIFNDYDQANAAYDGELGKTVNEWLEADGFHNFGFVCGGFRAISNTKKEITKPEDLAGKFHEVLKFMSDTRHVALCQPWLINKAFQEGLSDEDRQIVDDAAATMIAYNREAKVQEEEDTYKAIADSGVKVTNLTDEQRAAFRDKVTPIYDDYRAILGDEVMDLVLSYSK